jgi:hypothetical protein
MHDDDFLAPNCCSSITARAPKALLMHSFCRVGKTTASYETTTADDEDQELQDFKGEEGLDSTRSYGNEQNMYSQLQLSEYLVRQCFLFAFVAVFTLIKLTYLAA